MVCRNKKPRKKRSEEKILRSAYAALANPNRSSSKTSIPDPEPDPPTPPPEKEKDIETIMIEMIIEHRKRLRAVRKIHLVLCMIGLAASLYSVYVELQLEANPNYKALCDISPEISCTAVFGSEWGKGFGLIGAVLGANHTLNQPNGVFGAISYPIFIFTSRFDSVFMAKITLFIGVMGILLAWYLAYILIYILNDICLVCYTVYIANFLLLVTSVILYRNTKGLNTLVNIQTTPPKKEKKRV